MYKRAAVLVSAAALAQAAIVPTAPYGGVVERTGQACDIQYNLDTTGTWTNFTIELMTGDNFHMVHLDTVATGLDGTTGDGKYSWTCPEVTPNAAIYFYQFTLNGNDPTWTTRFTIAAADGTTTDAPNATQPDGKAIPWGTGALVGAPSDGGVAPVASTGTGSSGASSALTAIPSTTGTSASGRSTSTSTSVASDSSSASDASSSAAPASASASASSDASASGDETTVVTVTPSTTSSRMRTSSSPVSAGGSAAAQSGGASNTSGATKQGSSVAGVGLALALLAGAIFA